MGRTRPGRTYRRRWGEDRLRRLGHTTCSACARRGHPATPHRSDRPDRARTRTHGGGRARARPSGPGPVRPERRTSPGRPARSRHAAYSRAGDLGMGSGPLRADPDRGSERGPMVCGSCSTPPAIRATCTITDHATPFRNGWASCTTPTGHWCPAPRTRSPSPEPAGLVRAIPTDAPPHQPVNDPLPHHTGCWHLRPNFGRSTRTPRCRCRQPPGRCTARPPAPCVLSMPRTAGDLARWGRLLGNCLGDFAPSAASGRALIVGVERANRLLYAVEIDPNRCIRQFSGRGNRPPTPTNRALVIRALVDAGVIDPRARANAPWLAGLEVDRATIDRAAGDEGR